LEPSGFHTKVFNNKFLPKSIKELILIGASWTFRPNIFQMDRTEKAFAVISEILTFLALSVLMVSFIGVYVGLFLALIITHTIHWLFNGQVFVTFKNLGLTRVDCKRFIEYAVTLQQRIPKERYLSAAVISGSLPRGEIKESSDLDVHIIRQSGIINGVKACIFTFLERTRTFLRKFPLDICTFDNLKTLSSKLRQDEPLIILYDPEKKLQKMFSNAYVLVKEGS